MLYINIFYYNYYKNYKLLFYNIIIIFIYNFLFYLVKSWNKKSSCFYCKMYIYWVKMWNSKCTFALNYMSLFCTPLYSRSIALVGVTWLADTRVGCPVVRAAAVRWTQVGLTRIGYVTSVFRTDSRRVPYVDVGSVGCGLAHSHTLWDDHTTYPCE